MYIVHVCADAYICDYVKFRPFSLCGSLYVSLTLQIEDESGVRHVSCRIQTLQLLIFSQISVAYISVSVWVYCMVFVSVSVFHKWKQSKSIKTSKVSIPTKGSLTTK